MLAFLLFSPPFLGTGSSWRSMSDTTVLTPLMATAAACPWPCLVSVMRCCPVTQSFLCQSFLDHSVLSITADTILVVTSSSSFKPSGEGSPLPVYKSGWLFPNTWFHPFGSSLLQRDQGLGLTGFWGMVTVPCPLMQAAAWSGCAQPVPCLTTAVAHGPQPCGFGQWWEQP